MNDIFHDFQKPFVSELANEQATDEKQVCILFTMIQSFHSKIDRLVD